MTTHHNNGRLKHPEQTLDESVFESLYRGKAGLPHIADQLGMTLRALTEMLSSPASIKAIRALQDASDARTEMIVSRARASAAKELLKLTRDKDAKETARKACVDLLNQRRDDQVRTPETTEEGDVHISVDASETVRTMLERLGSAGAHTNEMSQPARTQEPGE